MSAVQRQTGRRAGNWIGQCRLKDRPISENHSPLSVRLSPPLLEFWAVSESHTPCWWRGRPGGGLRGQREVTIKGTGTKPQNWSSGVTVNCSPLDAVSWEQLAYRPCGRVYLRLWNTAAQSWYSVGWVGIKAVLKYMHTYRNTWAKLNIYALKHAQYTFILFNFFWHLLILLAINICYLPSNCIFFNV